MEPAGPQGVPREAGRDARAGQPRQPRMTRRLKQKALEAQRIDKIEAVILRAKIGPIDYL